MRRALTYVGWLIVLTVVAVGCLVIGAFLSGLFEISR